MAFEDLRKRFSRGQVRRAELETLDITIRLDDKNAGFIYTISVDGRKGESHVVTLTASELPSESEYDGGSDTLD